MHIFIINSTIIQQYEFLFCVIAGFFAGIFTILNHVAEISIKFIITKIISSMILGGFAFFLLDFNFITPKKKIAGSFIIAYGGAPLLNRMVEIIFNNLNEIENILKKKK